MCEATTAADVVFQGKLLRGGGMESPDTELGINQAF